MGGSKGAGNEKGREKHGAAHNADKPRMGVGASTTNAAFDGTSTRGMASVRGSVLFLAIMAVVYVAYLAISGQMEAFVSALSTVRAPWVIAALIVYVIYYVLGVTAYVIAVASDETSPVSVRDLMSVEAAGIFFSNLTPNGTGGAPAQIYRLTRAGLSVGGAGALQYTRFIIYEAGEGIFAALMLIPRFDYFFDAYGNVMLVGTLLFGAKIVEVAALLLACLLPGPVTRVGAAVLGWLHSRRLVKRYDHWHQVLAKQVGEFSAGFRAGARDLRLMGLTMAVTLVQLGCLYALPWFVLHAFGRSESVITCLACGSMLELLTSAVPLPGGTGGAEGGFAFLFGNMFGETLPAGYVVWRAVEYVIPVLCAVPLLGLRSHGGPNVYERLSRVRAAVARFVSRRHKAARGRGNDIVVRTTRHRDKDH